MTKYLLAAIAALSLVSILAFWRLDHATTALDASSSRIEELEASERSRKETIRLLGELDTQHTQERERANQTNADLRAAVAAGQRRLSVLAKCPGSATAGVGHAEARAELDPAAAERIVRIANDGDDAIRQLTALQDYVRTACPAGK
ncbi:TPA: lysis protein [Pseudomonas putida]|uniref:lysis protein n=1 Tax=Pseudomonas sp. HD6515 TaxID=2856556 RepID=UPI00217E5910|nr:lysis protein [Pseudomonas sp. HD6515]ELS0926013.1 lysis protein [Pseudomonas putida]UWH23472.1 lysis protein [Pseudomonas sp. HD6515]HDS0940901.1 lysis protein [Pseudomonas putida]